MSRTAFIFPGQGAQYIGMGREMAEAFPSSANVFDTASEALGYDIREMVFEGDEETLKITENTQPAILTASIACLMPLVEKGICAEATAGLSLGEYSAHVYAKTFEFSDAVRLVRKRGRYMQQEVPEGTGTMAAIIGLDNDTVIDCCRQASVNGIVEPANFNCPGQVVVAGEVPAVEKLVEICTEKGAKRAVVLPVSAPFHCSMLKGAGEKLKTELEKVRMNDPQVPVIANVSADYIKDASKAKECLISQVSRPVLWEESIRKMINDGIDTFVEIGPGKVLCGFLKRIDRKVTAFNIENIETLKKAMDLLGA